MKIVADKTPITIVDIDGNVLYEYHNPAKIIRTEDLPRDNGRETVSELYEVDRICDKLQQILKKEK